MLATLTWRRPIQSTGTVGIWRHYITKCGQYRVAVRISGPGFKPLVFYATGSRDGSGSWDIISKHKSAPAAKAA